MEETRGLKNNKKWIIAAVALVFVMAIMIITNIATKNNNQENDAEDSSSEQSETGMQIDFTNTNLIKSYISRRIPDQFFEDLQSVILDEEEIKTAPHENENILGEPSEVYIVSTSPANFTETEYGDNLVYTFDLEISDGREYYVSFITKNDLYYGYTIQRFEPLSNNAAFFITFADGVDITQYNRDEVISEIINWAKTLEYDEMILNVNDPNYYFVF